MNTPMLILGILNVAFIVTLLIMTLRSSGEQKSATVSPLEPGEEDLYQEYLKNRFLYRNDQALNFLQEYIWVAMKNDQSVKYYDALKLEHESKFIELGGRFPDHPYQDGSVEA